MAGKKDESNLDQLIQSFGTLTGTQALKLAVKAVPSMKYAVAVLGLFAVVGLVTAWRLNPTVAIVGAIVVLFFMFILFLFSVVASLAKTRLRLLALVVCWVIAGIFFSALILLLTSWFFRFPRSIESLFSVSTTVWYTVRSEQGSGIRMERHPKNRATLTQGAKSSWDTTHEPEYWILTVEFHEQDETELTLPIGLQTFTRKLRRDDPEKGRVEFSVPFKD